MSDEPAVPRVPLALPFRQRLRREGRYRGAALSAVLHAALIALLLWAGRRRFLEARLPPGEGAGPGGGGGGGGIHGLAIFTARAMGQPPAPPSPPVHPPAPALAVPRQVEPLPERPQPSDSVPPVPPASVPAAPAGAAAPLAGQGAGQGTGLGPGAGTGTGGGAGGGAGGGVGNDTGSGGGGTIFPPFMQGLLLQPPNPPGELKGVPLRVTFRIDERGAVVSVDVEPPIRDRDYRNAFLDRMRRYTFLPARTRDGRPVASQYVVTLTIH